MPTVRLGILSFHAFRHFRLSFSERQGASGPPAGYGSGPPKVALAWPRHCSMVIMYIELYIVYSCDKSIQTYVNSVIVYVLSLLLYNCNIW